MNYTLEDFKNELKPYFNFGELYGSVWLLSDGTTLPSYMKDQSKGTLHDELLDNLNELYEENKISEECVRYFNDKVVDDFHCIQLNSRECCIRLFRNEISSSEWWTIYDWIEFFIGSHHNDSFEVTWENKEGTTNWSTIRPSEFLDDPDDILKHIRRLFTHKEIYQEELNKKHKVKPYERKLDMINGTDVFHEMRNLNESCYGVITADARANRQSNIEFKSLSAAIKKAKGLMKTSPSYVTYIEILGDDNICYKSWSKVDDTWKLNK